MKVEFSKRAAADLRKVSADSRVFGEAVAAAVELRIRQVIAHIAAHPQAAARVIERPGMHVIPLIRYPYKIFYRVLEDRRTDTPHPPHVATTVDEAPVVTRSALIGTMASRAITCRVISLRPIVD